MIGTAKKKYKSYLTSARSQERAGSHISLSSTLYANLNVFLPQVLWIRILPEQLNRVGSVPREQNSRIRLTIIATFKFITDNFSSTETMKYIYLPTYLHICLNIYGLKNTQGETIDRSEVIDKYERDGQTKRQIL